MLARLRSAVEVVQADQDSNDMAADLTFLGEPVLGEAGVDVFLDRGFRQVRVSPMAVLVLPSAILLRTSSSRRESVER